MKHTTNVLNLIILNYFFEFIIRNNIFYILYFIILFELFKNPLDIFIIFYWNKAKSYNL